MQSVQSIQRSDDARDTRADRVEQLLIRCAGRDEQALEDLYQLVSAQLFGLLLRMLRRPSLAEEALQDVMIRVWLHAGQYAAHRGRAMTWLISIARYRAIDLARGQRDPAPLDEVPQELLTDPSIDDLSDTTTSERSQVALRDCLGRLSSDQRRCIELAYVDGYSHGEIAEKVERPAPTVRSWMRRGLASLKRCLDS
jgi:RNA polymerase sigma-70 factor, ECF subfamily